MRAVLSPFLTIKSARATGVPPDSPISIGVDVKPGAYDVISFASTQCAQHERENWYVLRRRGGRS